MICSEVVANILTAIGLVVAAASLFFGFRQYRKDQLWKRKEFVANKYTELKEDTKCRIALNMLDASENYIRLDSDSTSKQSNEFYVSHWTIAVALIPSNSKYYPGWDDRFGTIRKYFDSLFDHFEMLEDMRKAGLFSAEELDVYLGYWADAIANNRFNKKMSRNLILYMNRYHFRGSIDLIRSMGYPIDEIDKYQNELDEECRDGYWIRKVQQKIAEERY